MVVLKTLHPGRSAHVYPQNKTCLLDGGVRSVSPSQSTHRLLTVNPSPVLHEHLTRQTRAGESNVYLFDSGLSCLVWTPPTVPVPTTVVNDRRYF